MTATISFLRARAALLAIAALAASAGCAPADGAGGDGPFDIDEAAERATAGADAAAPPGADAAAAASSAVPAGPAGEVFALVNQARSRARSCGAESFAAAPPLRWDDRLGRAAQAHSADMAAKNYFSHTSADGRSFSERIRAEGYSFSRAGENIAAGQRTAAQVVDTWLKSPGHCRNIMNPAFGDLGVGQAAGGSFGVYWTQDFGRPL
jgi:uncharacterized protein YkwD